MNIFTYLNKKLQLNKMKVKLKTQRNVTEKNKTKHDINTKYKYT